MADLKAIGLALFAAAVMAKFVYIIVKAIRIVVLKVDAPMAGFDSEPAIDVPVLTVAEEQCVQGSPGTVPGASLGY